MRRSLALVFAFALMGVFASSAFGSQLIDRNVSAVTLAVNGNGQALVSYRNVYGRQRHVLIWGAINAKQPKRGVRQARFRLDYSGGYGTYHRDVWKTFKNACGPYSGPQPLAWYVSGCTAPDGSFWALQKWQVQLPDLGFVPWLPRQSSWELHISHWTGPTAQIEAWQDWVYSGRFHNLFGRYTYLGKPVYGFGTTRYGAPIDGYGRLIYLDTHGSSYSSGWRRENSFVPHKPTGVFCYGFYPHDPFTGGYPHPSGIPHTKRGPGKGDQYRITAAGPGVTPDVMWQGQGLHDFSGNATDRAYQASMTTTLLSILNGDRLCRSGHSS
jgi:hypothetical protein